MPVCRSFWPRRGLRLRATVLSVAIVANPNSQFPIGNIDIDNWQHFHIGNIQQDRPPRAACPPPFGHDRSADTKSPFGQHENACFAGCTKRGGRQKFLGRNHLRQGCSGQEDCKGMTLFEPALFASPAERAVSCGPKGPFVSGGAARSDRAQGRCDAHGEAKPQAVRRRAFLEVAARRPAVRRFSWLRASAPDEMLPIGNWELGLATFTHWQHSTHSTRGLTAPIGIW